MQGNRLERELRDRLDGAGFAVIRVAGSGSAPGYDLPDLIAGDGFRLYAIEVKSWNPEAKNTRYLTAEEATSLRTFTERFYPDVTARVGIRIAQDTNWYLPRLTDLPRTDSGNVPLSASDREEYPQLDALVS